MDIHTLAVSNFSCNVSIHNYEMTLLTCPERLLVSLPKFTTNSVSYAKWKPVSSDQTTLPLHHQLLTNSGFRAKILKIEPKLAVKSETAPDQRIQTIVLSLSRKEDWSFGSIPQQFKIKQIGRCQSRAVNPHACHARFCYREI